jgi:hypothetical protein
LGGERALHGGDDVSGADLEALDVGAGEEEQLE